METLFAVAIGIVVAASVYLFLSRDLLRILLGFILFGTGVNLAILLAGRVGPVQPPLIDDRVLAAGAANPLPQALILTAIVISFSFFAFLLVLVYRAYQDLGTDNGNEMRLAEPQDDPLPPTGY